MLCRGTHGGQREEHLLFGLLSFLLVLHSILLLMIVRLFPLKAQHAQFTETILPHLLQGESHRHAQLL